MEHHHEQTREPAHPFAEFIRILGKGKKGARALTEDEAYRALYMILDRQAEPEQIGAFLMLMRIKEETVDELVGFVRAARAFLPFKTAILADLDWASYAGKRRHLPWFLLAARLLAEQGIKILMHGAPGHTTERLYTETVLPILDLPMADSLTQAQHYLIQCHFCYVPLQAFSPQLHHLIELRSLMGLRSPVHTLVRLLNPGNAAYSIQGIFHPNYRTVHQQAAARLGQTHMAVLKGEGGETECNPDVDCLVQSVHDGMLSETLWPARFTQRHLKAPTLESDKLIGLWRGTYTDDYALASVLSTCAIALHLLGKAASPSTAYALAETYWTQRSN